MSIGGQTANIPSITKAKSAAIPIFSIIDEKSTLDIREFTGEDKIKVVEHGQISFRKVTFKYPSRNLRVLDNFDLEIPTAEKIALVGSSGCGKSTITNLIFRFYNIMGGEILIDEKPIEDYNLLELRRQIGFVMQEPLLFKDTIK